MTILNINSTQIDFSITYITTVILKDLILKNKLGYIIWMPNMHITDQISLIYQFNLFTYTSS